MYSMLMKRAEKEGHEMDPSAEALDPSVTMALLMAKMPTACI